jgi:hypothetical protein
MVMKGIRVLFFLLVVCFYLSGCTSITRVENFIESESKVSALNYVDEKTKSHVNILINNGHEKHYAHGVFHVPLFPTVLFSDKNNSSLDNNIMVVITFLDVVNIEPFVSEVLVNDKSRFNNLKPICKEGGNFVACYYDIPIKANSVKSLKFQGFSFVSDGIRSNTQSFIFNKNSNIHWRFIKGNRYSKRKNLKVEK